MSWSSADARLAKLCLYCVTPMLPTPPFLGSLEACFRVSKTKVIFRCVVGYGGFGAILGIFFRPACIISTIGPSFLTLDTSTCIGFWRGVGTSYAWCYGGNWGPKRAHDAHVAGCRWLLERLQCTINPDRFSLWAVFGIVNTSVGGTCTWAACTENHVRRHV